ncbi:MAG: hypothetical protein ACI4I5_08275 [Acutalibacteraceae bacterium]
MKMKKAIVICLSAVIILAAIVGAVFGIGYYKKSKYFKDLHTELEGLFDQEVVLTFAGNDEYDLSMQNTTQTVFKDMYFTFFFYDEDNSLVDESYTNLTVWSPGKGVAPKPWTSESFSKVEMMLEYYEEKYGEAITSESHEINFLTESPKHREMTEELESVFAQEPVLKCLGGEEYILDIQNTTTLNLKDVSCDLQFFDEKNNLVSEDYDYIDFWNVDEKPELLFFVDSVFSTVKLRLSYESPENNHPIATEYHEIKFENDASVQIKLKNTLPMKVDEVYDTTEQSYSIKTFEYSEDSWLSGQGQCSCRLKITGKKTYDRQGNNNTNWIYIDWRLYNDENCVVDSGSFSTESLKVEETFVIDDVYTDYLDPGTYYLEISEKAY